MVLALLAARYQRRRGRRCWYRWHCRRRRRRRCHRERHQRRRRQRYRLEFVQRCGRRWRRRAWRRRWWYDTVSTGVNAGAGASYGGGGGGNAAAAGTSGGAGEPGLIVITYTSTGTCSTAGLLRYVTLSSGAGQMEFCDGSIWWNL